VTKSWYFFFSFQIAKCEHINILDQASPKDIEDLATAGRLAHTCPYFGSRRAIPQAEVNLLLHFISRLNEFCAEVSDTAI
jgi:hypothetical protein